MAKECQGLPLALKVIGRAMFGKTSPELQWEPLLKNLRESRMQEKPVQELYERLKLGYDLLSEDDGRLKDSFLYFAAFPEDSMIYFKDILWHWIGMGFVPGNVGDDPRADAFSLLDKLRKRCFIESHGSICSEERDVLYFTVHDVMRDLAFYILVKDKGIPPAKELYLCRAGQNLEEFPQEWKVNPEAWILSLEKNKLEKLPSEIYAPKLVSLLLGSNPMNQLPRNFLSSFPKLRVLNLSGGHFIELPEAIGDLINLVWLDVQHCYLRTLPDSVRKLQMLKHLDVGGCQALMKLPSGIVELTSLQILNTFNCEELRWAEHTQLGRVDEFLNPTNAASLDDLCSLVSLTELRMADSIFPGRRFPNNISALSKLKVLHLGLRHIETLPADMAYWFTQLEVLQLWGSDCMQRLPRSFTSTNAFPALVNFELIVCFTLLEFPEVEQGALPKLQTLKFFGCASLQSLPLSLELLINLRKLTLIYLIYTPNISSLIHSCRINCENSWIWKKFVIELYNWMDSERLRLGGSHLD
jgi:Leucine-rich repeat (LRR) protein